MGIVLMGTGEVIHDQLKTAIFETYCRIIEVFDIYHVGMDCFDLAVPMRRSVVL